MCDQESRDPFARFLRAMFEGRVTELHITGQACIETGDGRRVAQRVEVSVVAGRREEEFKLETTLALLSQVVPVLALHMDRVDMLIPPKKTVGQKIVATEEPDAV